MKKSLLFSAVLAGLMLGSCSSSDDLAGGNTPANQDGNGYVAFTINLPSQSGSSSRANDNFNDGLAKEYSVHDATLILFTGGATEGKSSFVEAHTLSTAPWQNVGTSVDNITTQSKKIVQKVTKSITNAKALVILNNNGTLSVGDDGSLKVNNTNFTGTYAEFLEKTDATNDKTLTKDGFYMANAPLANGQGGSVDPTGTTVTTLTDLTGKIYDTEDEAKLGTPAEVYVERGVAKVTLNKGDVAKANNGTTDKVDFAISGWAIDNTNPTTYLVRSTKGFTDWMGYANEKCTTNPYRFVGHTQIASGLYRTYFAQDMNYDTDATGLQRVEEADFKDAYGDENPQYCFENTFNVKHQNENQTTLVAIKAKLNSGNDFYILGGDQTTLFGKTQLENLIKNKFMSIEEGWVKANAKDEATKIGGDDLTLTFDKDDAAGEISLTKVTVNPEKLKDSPEDLPTTYLKDVKAAVGSIVCYKNGVSYYTVRIKHFGDDLTPWKKGELGVEAGSVYPEGTSNTAEANWLGRYGVLRNNWYDITVDDVKGLGSATVPKLTGTTDDELESYIAVRINVLSWAKRTQGAILH